MKRLFCSILAGCFLFNGDAFGSPHTIPMGHMADSATPPGFEKPQMARDMEGLDPKEGGLSKGLRGSFTIRHYISGPWKGGTAVIEVASDSSYAEIRIFDAEGNLQRIYSIQPKSQNAHFTPSQVENPIEMTAQGQASSGHPTSESDSVNVMRSRDREAAVQAQTDQAMQSGRDQQETQAEMNARVRPGTISSRGGEIREASSEEPETSSAKSESAAASATAAATATQTAAATPAYTTRRKVIRVRKKRHHKKSSSSLDTPLSGEASSAPEDEYYYVDEVVVEKVPVTPAAGASAAAAESVSAKEPAAQESSPKAVQSSRQAKEQKPVQVAKAEPAPPPSAPARDLEHTAARSSGSIPVASGSGSSAYDESNLPDVTQAVKENEQDTAPSPAAVPRKKLESDSWNPKPVVVASLPGTAVELPPPPAVRSQPAAPPVEDLTAAKQAAAKLESDNWTPKPAAATPTDAELGLTNPGGTSRSTGRSKKGGNISDDMVPMSDQVKNGGQVSQGSAGWTPTGAAKLSPKEEQNLAMINSLKAVQPSPVVVKVNRDVNNPEEGVKPFYSLEKYSGSQFGRHREFERRVMYKQNKNTSVKGYDFYIDEVDRKQEKHYLYYYKIDSKTKKAKLIATEKHEKVTFLSNYDIGSEDKGKVSKE